LRLTAFAPLRLISWFFQGSRGFTPIFPCFIHENLSNLFYPYGYSDFSDKLLANLKIHCIFSTNATIYDLSTGIPDKNYRIVITHLASIKCSRRDARTPGK